MRPRPPRPASRSRSRRADYPAFLLPHPTFPTRSPSVKSSPQSLLLRPSGPSCMGLLLSRRNICDIVPSIPEFSPSRSSPALCCDRSAMARTTLSPSFCILSCRLCVWRDNRPRVESTDRHPSPGFWARMRAALNGGHNSQCPRYPTPTLLCCPGVGAQSASPAS